MAMFKICHPWVKYTCEQCKQENYPKIIDKGQHIEARCEFCDKWWKNISKEDKYGTKEQEIQIHDKTLGRCGYCGCNINPYKNRAIHYDHIKPQSDNGSNLEPNLIISCQTCNTQKGKKSISEYRKYLKEKSQKESWVFFFEILEYSFYGQSLKSEYDNFMKLNNTVEKK